MNFYESLPVFTDFERIVRDEYYRAAPADWVLVLTDVKDSRKAIARGKYKDVNKMGVATIVVARQVLCTEGFPFVFGGDGATFLIPPQYLNRVLAGLCDLKELALRNFGLDLRVGHIGVAELLAEGAALEVARYELTQGECLAAFRGDSVALAEEKIKRDERYQVYRQTPGNLDLAGLSCRWRAIPSVRGKIISLLIQARSQDTYREVLAHLHHVFPEGLEAHNPVDTEILSYKSLVECLREEWQIHRRFSRKFFKRCLIIVSMVMVYRWRIPLTYFRMYREAIRHHSDYRKFDGTLRMTLDCTEAQIALLRFYLDTQTRAGTLKYGIFENDSALITCYVEGLRQGEHIHFIDGADGGYAAAAEHLKGVIMNVEL